MDTDVLVTTLEEAGLSPYQAKAYVAILELGVASASEVAEASDVPQPRVYDVLSSLNDRGYVETYEADSIRARAHSPADVLEDLQERAERFERAADEVEDRWSQPELEHERASIVQRFQTVIDRAATFIDSAQYQIRLSVTPSDFDRLRPKLQAAHDRGATVRLSFHTGEDEQPPDPERCEGVCLEARHRDFPAPFVAVVDRTKTCFSHHRDSVEEYGVLVNDRIHTYVFHWYFLTCLWEGWPRIYSAQRDEFPIEYVDIRQFVRDVDPLLDDGVEIELRVEGQDQETRTSVDLTGTVVDTIRGPPSTEGAGGRLSGQVSVVLDVGDERVTVGGWGAMVEDYEATRLTVQDVDAPENTELRGLTPER
ncbi:MAG: TrmB family transcriptional regulator [Haloarculaceae archaeon]